jgi:hypothetical protein
VESYSIVTKNISLNIREDAEGYIWFSSAKGVGRIDPLKSELILFTNANRKNKKQSLPVNFSIWKKK